jgi:hypothetical protein
MNLAKASHAYQFGRICVYSKPYRDWTNIAAAAAGVLDAVRKTGKYRLDWLKAFRDLGSPKNFAYYYASEGFYNYLQPFQKEGDLVRGINIGKRLKKEATTNEVTGATRNNLDREQSTFLSFELVFP